MDKMPSLNPIAEKKINVATAETISGTMIGKEIRAKLAGLPRKFPPLIIPIDAAVAMLVAVMAAMTAMISELRAANLNFSASGPTSAATRLAKR